MSGISSLSDINALNRPGGVSGSFSVTQKIREEQDDRRLKAAQEAGAPVEKRPAGAPDDMAHPDPDSKTLARSADGDTTRASRASLESLKDGMVFKKTDQAAKGEAPDEQEKGDRPITSMTGYTDTQVESLYRRGEISRQDYEKEMDRREKIDEASGLAEEKNPVIDSAKEASAKEVLEEQTEKLEEEKKENLQADETAPGRPDRTDRAGGEQEEQRKQLITEEIENNREFINTMGEMSAQKQDFSLRADAVMDAQAAGREELMQQVMEAADRVAATEPTQ